MFIRFYDLVLYYVALLLFLGAKSSLWSKTFIRKLYFNSNIKRHLVNLQCFLFSSVLDHHWPSRIWWNHFNELSSCSRIATGHTSSQHSMETPLINIYIALMNHTKDDFPKTNTQTSRNEAEKANISFGLFGKVFVAFFFNA